MGRGAGMELPRSLGWAEGAGEQQGWKEGQEMGLQEVFSSAVGPTGHREEVGEPQRDCVFPSGAGRRGAEPPAGPRRGCHEGGQRGQAGPAGPRDQSRASQCRVTQVRRLRAPWQSWEGSAMARRGEGGLKEVGFPPTQPHLSRFWLAARRTASSCGVPAAPP